MTTSLRGPIYFAIMASLLIIVGLLQSWSVSLAILNLCLISAIMALGVNMQWGYAGLFNVGIMGFAALGGVACVLVSKAPVGEAWSAGAAGLGIAAVVFVLTIALMVFSANRIRNTLLRRLICLVVLVAGLFICRRFFDPAVSAIEAVNAAKYGYLGGLGLPIIFSWAVGGLFAAGAAWLVGKIALGLRSDYLAIATLGISEIIIAILKNEDWLTRGVKNVTGLGRPVPYELKLQQSEWFLSLCERWAFNPVEASSIFVKLCYALLFASVLIVILFLSQRALKSPWGRMMRAIRDNEHAAEAMGKDVTRQHLHIFILGSAVVGIAGAMLTTLDGQFTPTAYNPLRFTFLIWVMVIVGGSGNNWGSVLGGFLIWFIWIEAEPVGLWLMNLMTQSMSEDSALRIHLIESAPHMRVLFMGAILLLVLRFSPRGLIPEATRR